MAVFPEQMSKIDPQDPQTAAAVIDQYIRYMTERIEFSMRNVTKSVSAAGVSNAEIYVLLQAQAQQLAALQSAVNQISGQVSSIGTIVGTLQTTVSGLQSSVNTINGQITTLQADVGSLQTSVNTINGQISSLDERVTALENA